MQTPIPQLTALLLFLHISFGCCWHHAHTCEEDCCDAPSMAAESCPCSDHHQDDKPSHRQDPAQDHSRSEHQCSGDQCVFTKTETSSDILSPFTLNLVLLDLAPEFVSLQIASTAPNVEIESRHASGYPPLGTYLLHQILLI